MYGLVLIPLILFGLYKNGVQLYDKGFVSILGMLKPIILLSMGACGGLIGTIIREYRKNKVINTEALNKSKGLIIEAVVLGCTLPINSSPIILFAVTLVFGLFMDKCITNKMALMYIVVQGLNMLMGISSFANPYEVSTVLNYDGVDLFLGFGSGGICSTSIILIIVGLIVLSCNKLYKREMVYSAILSFLILGTVPSLINSTYEGIFSLLFGYNILFVFVFVAPSLYSSSYTSKGLILSGIVLGIVTYFLTIVSPFNAAMAGVLVVSLMSKVFDKLFALRK